MTITIQPATHFRLDTNSIAADKSISHRCAIFSLLCKDSSFVENYLLGEDTLNSLKIAKQLGLSIKEHTKGIELIPPKDGIQEPKGILECGNAGTAIRLYMGLLSTQKGLFVLSGDEYLNVRPMGRVAKPLSSIGAQIYGRDEGKYAPIVIVGNPYLENFTFKSEIPSAQVKSALILAALFSKGECYYYENELSRNHSEKMLCGMGADIQSDIQKEAVKIKITPLKEKLKGLEIKIPSDPSSAFFFAVAIAIMPNSSGILRNVLLNPTRIEAFKMLEKMGVQIEYKITQSAYEDIGDIYLKAPNTLQSIEVSERISWLIDELPALAIAMACAKGESLVKNAKELRVKECDRIYAVVENLKACGIEAKEFEDGFSIVGGEFKKAEISSFGDHRIAMSFAIAGLKSGITIKEAEYINISFPNFLNILKEITTLEEKN
ncbi:3-phosphoshikimate 1-carboxyvinyltransferase [Helicobacter valdiviensis]|uniref:3-phosphoshikimate 1-carboxyvinyltransferase n=1 Tax=Helicobacter valdiviensis TaxID=1458358 RepID=A0A2W6MXQ6_9HELI|nr:3-phosphoshikimate 1-carboxyvinyltransferase [Helicobacter valdiviensis]PZT48779.1 3-phosphoshikimate 1-carboxyvinyltransferase [Helicobacter valdiviensis]